MNIFKQLFKNKQHKNAVNETGNFTTPTSTIAPVGGDDTMRAEYVCRNLTFAFSYAASLNGITLQPEQLTTIMQTVNRVVFGQKAPSPANTTAQPQPKEKNYSGNGHSFKPNLLKFDAWIRLHYALRINLLTGCTEIAERKEVESEQVYHVVSNYDKCSITQDAMCDDINLWKMDVETYLESNKVPSYHPFTQYFEQLPKWDGKDRVTDLAERVSTNSAWVRNFHRWMLGVTAQWMGYARKNRKICNIRANSVAPILISEHQGWGKSTFCRMLLPEELQRYYTDSFDVAQPSACEVKLTEFGLINLDEFDRIPESRNAQLKNIMQMTALNIRKAFQKNGDNKHRIASFIGTSNRRNLLTDPTGSRRFLCVELTHAIDCDTPIEYEQLYAQLKEEILAGERYWFSEKEEDEIQEQNLTFYQSTPIEEMFHRVFRAVDEHTEGAMHLPAFDIYRIIKEKYPTCLTGISAAKFARELPKFANRMHKHNRNGYFLVLR
jgi:hypothetical protein